MAQRGKLQNKLHHLFEQFKQTLRCFRDYPDDETAIYNHYRRRTR